MNDDTTNDGTPVAPVRQREDGRWTVVVCPLCGAVENHLHGGTPGDPDPGGSRVAHCLVKWPGDPSVYVLEAREPTADEIAAGEARRREIADNMRADGWSRRELRSAGLLR